MKKLRLVFAGTPAFAAQHLAALLNTQHDIVAVYTQADRPAGRGRKLTASPVKQLALASNLTVIQPHSLKTSAVLTQLQALQADLMIVVAYGLILPAALLGIPRLGCINVHASLLPRWRGAAPIQAAILEGDRTSGISLMQMDAGLDTGDILIQQACELQPDENSASLHDKLAYLGASLLVNNIDAIAQHQLTPRPQDETQATYAAKISKAQAKIDWQHRAINIERKIRAFNPWPVAFTQLEQQTVRIWQAHLSTQQSDAMPGTIMQVQVDSITVATADQALNITRLQLSGGKVLAVRDILNAHHDTFTVGKRFS